MENNKKDYSDFFRPADDHKYDEQEDRRQERPSYYYSYGPYKSQTQSDGNHEELPDFASSESSQSVEVTAPKPVKPFPYASQYRQGSADERPPGNWRVNEPRKRSSFKSIFASFMAGALVVSSLMFASDKMNLFTGGQVAETTNSVGAVQSGDAGSSSGGSESSGVTGAAYNISRPDSISAIVREASPAVVKVVSYVTSSSSNSLDPFFEYFFGGQQRQQQQQQQQQESRKVQSGMGTGFIFEKSGYIITNQHVIDGAEEIQVTVEGYDEPFVAELLGNSFDLDLAVLKITGDQDFSILPIGDSSAMEIGEWVVAIGNPLGFEHTVTVGVLSAKEREISIPESTGTRTYEHLLQTDASINPGNSGGPLLNMNGEVIGINTAVNAEAQGMGFAIPASTISQVLENLKNNVEIPKEPIPFIGADLGNVADLSDQAIAELKLDKAEGSYVNDVIIGTPAFRAGLKKYDVIESINGTAYATKEELIPVIQGLNVGDTVTFGIIRDGQKLDLEITLGDKNEYLENQ